MTATDFFASSFSELTISSGAITPTQFWHTVDTESDASSDNLDTIAAGFDGEFLLLRPANDARTILVRHNQAPGATNNILNADNDADINMTAINRSVLFQYQVDRDTNGAWAEITRSLNYDDTGPEAVGAVSGSGVSSAILRGDHVHALNLLAAIDAASSTVSNGSGLEWISGSPDELALLQGCSDLEFLRWTESSDTWGCDVGPTDTNANTECTGATTYLSGDGGCNTLDGLEDFETPTGDAVVIGNGSTYDVSVLPDCDAVNEATSYVTGSNSFACQTFFSQHDAVFMQSGVISTAEDIENLRFYNNTGAALTIQDVRCSVNTAPTDASLIVDINENGTTIFSTQGNRPTIVTTGFTDVSGTPDDTSWADGNYLQIEIDQVGSTIAGSDLTCQVTARQALYNAAS